MENNNNEQSNQEGGSGFGSFIKQAQGFMGNDNDKGAEGDNQQQPEQQQQQEKEEEASGGGGGFMENMKDSATDLAVNQKIDAYATEAGVPAEFDGAINAVVDEQVNKYN